VRFTLSPYSARNVNSFLPRLESGLNATSRLPTLQSTLGPLIKEGHLSSYSVKEEQIGGRKGRAGTGTMGAATVGERTTHGSQDSGRTGRQPNVSWQSRSRGVAKVIAVRTTDGTRIGSGALGREKSRYNNQQRRDFRPDDSHLNK
jgi:hypothetical protein